MKEIGADNFNWRICGHEKAVRFLQLSLSQQKIAHAYMFIGPEGVGKYTVAKKFIASIFCQSTGPQRPCGNCQNCLQINSDLHPDIFFVEHQRDEKTGRLRQDISVDQIRDLRARLQQGSLLDGYKAAVIPEAELLNSSSANALLKLLEEPTARTTILLLASNQRKIPPTIASRCQVLRFLPVATEKIINYLQEFSDVADAEVIARLSANRPGLAIRLAGSADLIGAYQQNVEFFLKILESSLNERLKLTDELIDWGLDEVENSGLVSRLLNDWQLVLRDLLLIKQGKEQLVINLDFLPLLNKLSQKSLKKYWYLWGQAHEYLNQKINSKTVLENLIINL